MRRGDAGQLVSVAAIWGASYLFIRIGAPEFGAAAMGGVRAVAAAALLGDRLTLARMAGLALGFGGVVLLVAGKLHFVPQQDMLCTALAALACLMATLLYGISGNFSKRYLSDVPPLAVTTGSQLVAAIVLAGPALLFWPAAPPSAQAWGAVLALAALCTTFAYVLFFGLIARLGASRAMSALFLIPAFGVLWGCVFLGESFSLQMGLSCLVILAGCALTTGLLPGSSRWTVPFMTRRA